MHFKHPEFLFFLLLLVVPILVHLFQLRRFKKEYFTNVKILRELSVQTRKSSKIKKWLLLATRLFVITFLVIAFAQPFFKATDTKSLNNELFIILDNSHSMQAKGKQGELLKRSVQDLLIHVPQNCNFSLLTNDENYWNISKNDLEKEVNNITYSAIPFSLESSLIKINARKTAQNKDIVVITDAIGLKKNHLKLTNNNPNTYFIIPKAEQLHNVAIDSVFLSQSLDDFYEIGVLFSSNYENKSPIPVALYNNGSLVAKSIIALKKNQETVTFTIPKERFNGYVTIQDNSLVFDNSFYFSIAAPKKIAALGIGEDVKNKFLSRIYTAPEFDFKPIEFSKLDYSKISPQDVIVLNELKNIPIALQTNLKSFISKGGNVVLIPSETSDIENLNTFLSNFKNIRFLNTRNQERQITKINFSNPLFSNVFEKKITNFQFPKIKQNFELQSSTSPALELDDHSTFLTSVKEGLGTMYVFSAPLNQENSNFQNSPLIVPTFYKMGSNNSLNGLYQQTIGDAKAFIIKANAIKGQLISIKNNTEEFIPMQQIVDNKIKVSCIDNPKKAGNFNLVQNQEIIESISFNYDREESLLEKPSAETLESLTIKSDIESFFETIAITRTDSQIWKWFLALTLLFLFLEVLIQKFVK